MSLRKLQSRPEADRKALALVLTIVLLLITGWTALQSPSFGLIAFVGCTLAAGYSWHMLRYHVGFGIFSILSMACLTMLMSLEYMERHAPLVGRHGHVHHAENVGLMVWYVLAIAVGLASVLCMSAFALAPWDMPEQALRQRP